ncbi:hypothetical protein DICPUDRAFT_150701 [Dictyostelium purpureum]|uniref:DUF7906 domain-containing protein n=1 Tax=Dictyostelium purpureum TaxID=5786 RepID=F0ZH11_DICPU|nr:uncharacterized protein DICPUDRAFT_150701 [Dictyostelium purpureum]EGC36772.1 hypothetical protein DICPUDRAFT_150701 [Dictyostelium purpureum]|eukprot:XP_003286718.1 hypothetical protein DICPUDRAFT_150701 [Dictyostelium purpureum]
MKRLYLISIILVILLIFDHSNSFDLGKGKAIKRKKLKHKQISEQYEEKSNFHHTDHIEDYQHEDHDKNLFNDKNIDINNLNSTLKLWLESNNIAKFMDFHTTKKLHLTIPINFIFIGFAGEGNRGFEISDPLLVEWFQHIEHALHNVITPIGEDYSTTDEMETPSTHIEYNFEIQVSKTDPLVNTLVEDAIFWHLRSEASNYFERNNEEAISKPQDEKYEKRFYANPHLVSSLLSSLSQHLEIDKDSYTIFIMNPNHPSNDGIENTDAVYGYRVGFSNQELEQIYKNTKLKVPESLNVHTDYEFAQAIQSEKVEKKKDQGEAIFINNNLKFRDYTKQSKEWADKMIVEFDTYKKNTLQSSPNCMFGSPDTKEDRWICTTLELLYHENSPILERAQEIFTRGTKFEQLYVYTAYENKIFENPMVDTWISHKRFAFIDLTAGPFSWGPSVGGNGLKTFSTLPIPPFISEDEERAIDDEEIIHLSPDKHIKKKQIEEEILLTETIYGNNCGEQSLTDEQKELCENLQTSISELKLQLEKISMASTAKSDQSTAENNNDDMDFDFLTGNFKEVFGNKQQDKFVSKLGSVLSSSLKHLVTQPLPLFKIQYASRVNFNVFIISDHNDFNPRDYFNFNYELFKYEIEKLRLPGQEFSFNIKTISMSDDRQLALAYYTSLKSILNPTINDDHQFQTQLNYYLDSKEIRSNLLKLFGKDFDTDKDEDVAATIKYIPIFLFSVSNKIPILIDKTHQAKSLSNMVIGIQTSLFSTNSSFTVNDNQIKYYPINPLSSILSATALNLGGLVGNHVAYSEAHKSATSNWHWSVGDSPTSKTFNFPFTHFNEFQRDTIFRNYVAASLERSIQYMNKAVSILSDCKTSIKNFENALSVFPLDETVINFQSIRSKWNQIALNIRDLDYRNAIKTAIEAETLSKSFYKDSKSIQIFFMESECQSDLQEKVPKRTWAIVTICLFINILIILFFKTLYKSKSKIKIN